MHDAAGLELPQAGGQDVRPDPGEPGGEVGVAGRALQQLADDEQRPALAHEREGVRDRAVLVEPLPHRGAV